MTGPVALPFNELWVDGLIGWCEQTARADPRRKVAIGSQGNVLCWRYVIERTPESCVYVHHWQSSDPDDLHDHPWDFTSWVLRGQYIEELPPKPGQETPRAELRCIGSIAHRKATDKHRVIIEPGADVWSMILTGPEQREWGFHVDGRFMVGREYRNRPL